MKVEAGWVLPVYQLIGPIVRVHWDYEELTREDDMGLTTYWRATEVVVPKDATPEQALELGVPADIAAEFKPENFTPSKTTEE